MVGLVSRRSFLRIGAGAILAAGCVDGPRPTPSGSVGPGSPTTTAEGTTAPPLASRSSGHSPSAMSRVLFREAALADGTSGELRLPVSILVEDGTIAWIRASDAEEDPGRDVEIIDASGATIVPGMVDAHSHLTGPGGAHWIDRFLDPTERLLTVAEENGALLTRSGVRWARDVGAPTRKDPVDGRERGLNLGIRDRWRDRPDHPVVRAAGTWVIRAGVLPAGLAAEARDGDELLALSLRQLDDGADFVKLYLNLVEPEWTTADVARVVEAVHGRGRRVTAHSITLGGARVAVEAGVDAIEHGFEIDADLARAMAGRTALVSTLTVFRSRLTFAATTRIERFASVEGRRQVEARLEQATESVRLAHQAGVLIAAGTDFGGGSPRAGQLAWEVESLVAAGLEPWEALAAATRNGGLVLGEREAGLLREGGPADFFLVHGDPLSDPSALWRVWRVGWAS